MLHGYVHPETLDDEEDVKVRSIDGLEKIQDVVLVDQSPIVRTPAPLRLSIWEFSRIYEPCLCRNPQLKLGA